MWQYDGERLVFKSLGADGGYHAVECSIAFPDLSSAHLQTFIHRRGTMGEIALYDELAKSVRAALKKQ